MGVDHAVAPNPKRKNVLAAARKGARRERQLTFLVLFGKERSSGRDTPENGHGPKPRRPTALGQRESPRGTPGARPSPEHALALERAQMVERRPWCDVEPLADLADGRRHAVTAREVTDEVQNVALPTGQLTHRREFS